MKSNPAVKNALRNWFILPSCVLLLNLLNQLVSYKAKLIDDALLRTLVVIALVLFGGTLVGFVAEPAIGALVHRLHRGTRQRWGEFGEIAFVALLGLLIFWLYYRIDAFGPGSLLPAAWRNPRHAG